MAGFYLRARIWTARRLIICYVTRVAVHPHLPSPPEGEGYTELQQQRTGEGGPSKESSCEEAPSPIIVCGNCLHALSLKKGRGQMRHRHARRRDVTLPARGGHAL